MKKREANELDIKELELSYICLIKAAKIVYI